MLQRRQLLGSSILAGMTMASAAEAQGPAGGKRARVQPQLLELRTYKLRIGAQPKVVDDFFTEAFIPLLNRLGVKTVGAFGVTFGPEVPSTVLLLPHASLAAYGALQDRLTEELPKLKGPAAEAFFSATQPAYVRMDSQLLMAFDSMPTVESPAKGSPRIFELRTYETPNELANVKKMQMFTPQMGELEIFRRVGLTPVFFGKTLIGPRQPSFVYMLTFPDLAAREAAWKKFREDPAWLKLKATPGYTDAEIMSNISDLVLSPKAYSQV